MDHRSYRVDARRAVAALLVFILLGGVPVLALSGCRPQAEQLTLETLARELQWTVTPVSAASYALEGLNQRSGPVGLAGFEVRLEARTAEGALLGHTAPVTLPSELGAASAWRHELSLPAEALWPERFSVEAVASSQGDERRLVLVAAAVSPGGIFVHPLWPEHQQVDVAPAQDNHLILSFDVPVDLASLGDNLSINPPLPFTLEAVDPAEVGASGAGFAAKVRPEASWQPFTRYTVTVAAGLTAADGSGTVMGRPRGFTFSTAGRHRHWWSQPPTWSPDGRLVAWVAPSSDGGASLWVGEVATLQAVRLATDALPARPAFSPDSQRLYYPAAVSGGLAIKAITLDTLASSLLIEPSRFAGAYSGHLLASPGGGFLAVQADLGGVDAHSDLQSEVYIYNLESGVLTRLPGEGFTRRLVGWLGELPVYAVTHENYDHAHQFRYNLLAFDPAAGSTRVLVDGGKVECVADFALAGAAAVGTYSGWRARSLPYQIVHEPADIWLLTGLDQSAPPDPVRLTTGVHCRQAVPAPDGTVIAAALVREGSWDIVLINPVAGGEETLIAGGPAAQSAPAWSPDGSRLAYLAVQGSEGQVVLVDPITRASGAFPPIDSGP